MKQENRTISTENYFCIHCAAKHGDYVRATKIVFDDDENVAMPVCEACFKKMEMEDSHFFSVFSLN